MIHQHESPHRSSRGGHAVKLVVIHGDAGKSDEGTISWLQMPESRVSYHYLIGRGGAVHQFVDEAEKAWHAGKSEWPGCTVGNSVNPTSIGVAFANDGEEPYEAVQYEAGAALVASICQRHALGLGAVVGHADVSPGRKTDPWARFDWPLFRQLVADIMEAAPESTERLA